MRKYKSSVPAERAITPTNGNRSLMSAAMGSWGASRAGTSPAYVLCRDGHISVGFSASGYGRTFSRLLLVCIHLILPRSALRMAPGQLWGFRALLVISHFPSFSSVLFFYRTHKLVKFSGSVK